MVFSMRILRRTRFSTSLYPGNFSDTASTLNHRHTHTRYNQFVIRWIYSRVMRTRKVISQISILDRPDDMRRKIIPPISNRRRQIGYLQRCRQHLSLADRDRYHGYSFPTVGPVYFAVKIAVRNKSPALPGQIDSQPIPVTHIDDILFPSFKGSPRSAVLIEIIDHRPKCITKIGIAGSRYSRYERYG